MKSKLLPILLFLLILLNGVLIFMLVKKPHENRQLRPERNFLTEQLNFSDSQKVQFIDLDNTHRSLMMEIDGKVMEQKDVLFNSFQKEDFNTDSLTTKIGLLEGEKDSELFRFFKKVRTLCTPEQALKFDKIIKQALRGGDKAPPPRDGMNHHPRGEGMPPPPR